MRKKILFLAALFAMTVAHAQVHSDTVEVEAQAWIKNNPHGGHWKKYTSLVIDRGQALCQENPVTGKYNSDLLSPREKATGFFRTQKIDGKWYLIDPEGYRHLHAGLGGVKVGNGETQKESFGQLFGEKETWMKATAELMRKYDFSGTGGWSDDKTIQEFNRNSTDIKISYCPVLGIMAAFGKELGVTYQRSGNIGYPNQCIPVFNPEFSAFCDRFLEKRLERYLGDSSLVGYFSDNELPISRYNLRDYMLLPEDDYGHIAAKEWLEERGLTAEDFTEDLGREFCSYEAETYFRIVSQALKKHDPDHMYLGCRLHGGAKHIEGVIEAAGRYCDVISINYYGHWNVREKDFDMWAGQADKPTLITEFYVKAEDSGLENSSGAGWIVHTQKDRGLFYENFVLKLLEDDHCIGWHWFRYQDNDPTTRRVDPSNINSNKGILDNHFHPYTDLTSPMGFINRYRYVLKQQM